MDKLLLDLKVREDTLTPEEKLFLNESGYLNLGKLLSDHQVSKVNEAIKMLFEKEGENAGSELMDSKYIKHPKEAGADRLADLVNKGEVFDIFYTHPRVLAGIAHVLGQKFKLSSLNYRSAKPGMGLQKLHVDWHEAVVPGQFKVCNSIWLLDDFSKENGATRIVPGTHLSGDLPQDKLSNQEAPHADEVINIFGLSIRNELTVNDTAAASLQPGRSRPCPPGCRCPGSRTASCRHPPEPACRGTHPVSDSAIPAARRRRRDACRRTARPRY